MELRHLLFLFSFLGFSLAHGQFVTQPKLMEVTPPSPSAAALTKFGDTPVGLSTGLPNISIPVYQYSDQSNGLTLSVSLDYHAGGIRVQEHASNVGLGWALNAGGVVTRTVRGIADETPNSGFFAADIPENETIGNSPSNVSLRPFNNIAAGLQDGQNDVFSFNFNGRSGQFSFGKNNDIILNKSERLKVTRQVGQVGGYTVINRIDITDESGFTYVFAAAEMMTTMGSVWTGSKRSATAWYLTEVISPVSNEKIVFQYADFSVNDYLLGNSSTQYRNMSYAGGLMTSSSTSSQSLQGKRLTKVSFPNGVSVDLSYNSAQRSDLPGDHLLNKLTVTDGTSKHGLLLSQDYSLQRATLKVATPFIGAAEVAQNPYVFEYFTSGTTFPIAGVWPDHWGYFRGNGSSSPFPREIFPQGISGLPELPGSNKDTDPLYVKIGSLTKITYPSGGYTTFDMEANTANHSWLKKQFVFNGTTYSHIQPFVGGLRVKKISDFDGVSSNPVSVREYEYLLADGITSSGALGAYPTYSYSVRYDYNPTNFADVVGYSGSVDFIVRSSSSVYEMVYGGGSVVSYERVVEKRTSNGQHNGSTISIFTANQPFIVHTFPIAPPYYRSFSSGLLKEEHIYGADNTLLKKTVNNYNFFLDNFFSDPARSENFRSVIIVPVKFHHLGAQDHTLDPRNTPLYFRMRDYLPSAGRAELASKVETFYETGGAYVRRWGYGYDPVYFYKNVDTLSDSRGIHMITRFSHPAEMVSANRDPNGVYQGMLNKNILAPVVEQVNIKENSVIFTTRTDYVQSSSGAYLPQKVFTKSASLPEEQRLYYQSYNSKGRALAVSLHNGPVTSYLWDYFGQYLVAEVKNAKQSDIAYAGFEAEAKGNWAYSGATAADATSPGGKRRYALSGGSLGKSGLTASKKYRLVYWIKGTTQPGVSSGTWSSAVLLGSRNGWSQYQREVSGVTAVTLSGSAILDEVRLYPAESEMTTYTYEPLVGMTSMTDASGRTRYYDYDAAQRLIAIRDQDGMLVQSFCYNYAGQQVDCGSSGGGSPTPEDPVPPADIIMFSYSANQADMCANVPLLVVDGYLSPATGKYHNAYTHEVLATGYYKKTDGTYLYIENGFLDLVFACPN